MLYIANRKFLHKFCINRKKRTLKPSFLRALATRRIIRADTVYSVFCIDNNISEEGEEK